MYDPIEFWNNRKHPNSDKRSEWQKFRYDLHANFIEKNIRGCNKILDFGAGKGGFFKLYNKLGIKKVISYDISDSFEEAILERGTKFNFNHMHIVNKVLVPKFNFKVDAVVCCNSLQHSRPENILDVLKELKRVSNKIIGLESFWLENAYKPDRHWTAHNYPEICKKMGWGITKEFIDTHKQLHFVIL